jgi:hypothetical protein
MGAVFRPKDLGRGGYRKVIEHSIRESEERLRDMVGYDRAQEIFKSINEKKKGKIT